VYILNKQIKIIFAVLIVGLIIFPQNAKGAFGVEVNYQTAYRISEASYDVSVYDVSDVFSGYLVNGDVIEENTKMIINVESIDPTELNWNSTVNNKTVTGTCYDAFDSIAFQEFLLSGYFLMLTFDIPTIISSGVIPPEYLDAFYLPLFVSIAPITWSSMEQFSIDQAANLGSIFGMGGIVIDDMGTNWVETSEEVSLEYWYGFNYTIMVDSYMELNSSTNFSYDKTTGSLLESEIRLTLGGKFGGYPFTIIANHHVEKTNLPFNLLDFLTENMWYFIGGGAGLVVISIVAIIFRIKRK